MQNDFDLWNNLKQNLNKKLSPVYANTREIWWCSIGLNIGTELYGKNELFERPVLVLKVYNKETIKIVPLTSKEHINKYYVSVTFNITTSYASLAQTRTVSTKRLLRKIGRIDKKQFNKIIESYKHSI